MKITSCPLCGNKEGEDVYEVSWQDEIIKLRKCLTCGHHFSFIDENIVNVELYKGGAYKVVDNRGSIFERIIESESRKIVAQIERLGRGNAQLLDFGCGKGIFLHSAESAGFDVFGVETAIERASFAKKQYGIEQLESLEYVRGQIFSDRMSVITMLHVLEHLPKPKGLLRNLIKDNLKEDGIFVLEVPNWDSWQRHIAGRNWMQIDIPRHVSHFDRDTLCGLLSELGLRMIKEEQFSLHLGVLGMVDALLRRTIETENSSIIARLKGRDPKTLVLVGLVLPFAFILERIAAGFHRGGIIRLYCQY